MHDNTNSTFFYHKKAKTDALTQEMFGEDLESPMDMGRDPNNHPIQLSSPEYYLDD